MPDNKGGCSHNRSVSDKKAHASLKPQGIYLKGSGQIFIWAAHQTVYDTEIITHI